MSNTPLYQDISSHYFLLEREEKRGEKEGRRRKRKR
jgi:hypothetical protein